MFGCMGALGKGPDPSGMTCEAVIKGYNTNKRLAVERSAAHRGQHEARVKELTPRYQACTAEAEVAPLERQGEEIQAIIDQVNDGGGGQVGPGRGPATASSTARSGAGSSAGLAPGKIIMVVAVGGAALLLLALAMKKRSP